MNDKQAFSRSYSPFGAVWAVFLVLIAIHGWQSVALVQQKKQLQTALKEAANGQLVNETMLKVSRDLIQMAAVSPRARQIVEDFKIQLTAPPSAGGLVSKPAEPAAASKNARLPAATQKK